MGSGTSHLPAFSLRFCLMVLERTFARLVCSRSRRYAGMAPGAASSSTLCLLVRSLCCWMVFFIVRLLRVALLGVELRLEAYELLRHRAALMRLARLLLALLLIVVQPAAVPARGGEGGKRPSDSGCFAAAAVSRRKTGRGAAWMRSAATRARVGGGKRGARRRESVRTASGRARCVRSAAWCLALSVSRLSTTAARSRTPTRRGFSPRSRSSDEASRSGARNELAKTSRSVSRARGRRGLGRVRVVRARRSSSSGSTPRRRTRDLRKKPGDWAPSLVQTWVAPIRPNYSDSCLVFRTEQSDSSEDPAATDFRSPSPEAKTQKRKVVTSVGQHRARRADPSRSRVDEGLDRSKSDERRTPAASGPAPAGATKMNAGATAFNPNAFAFRPRRCPPARAAAAPRRPPRRPRPAPGGPPVFFERPAPAAPSGPKKGS